MAVARLRGITGSLLPVLPQARDRRAAAVEVRRELRNLLVGENNIVNTPEHFAERGQTNGLIHEGAIQHGRVICGRP